MSKSHLRIFDLSLVVVLWAHSAGCFPFQSTSTGTAHGGGSDAGIPADSGRPSDGSVPLDTCVWDESNWDECVWE